jgi:Zn-dependent M28 family amino/carboxypeptidase
MKTPDSERAWKMAAKSSFVVFGTVFLLFCAVHGCAGQRTTAQNAENSINARDLERHVLTLASDEFQGRKPFTTGETKTIEYLESEFAKMGFEGANGGSFIQDVPLVELKATPSQYLEITTGADRLRFRYATEFIASTRRIVTQAALDSSAMVFAGYGIVAPEYDWNDYDGVDVGGKTVIVLVNDPGFAAGDESLFKGTTMTYYGRWTYKYEEAARQGAAGVLVVHETSAAGYPWTVLRNGAAGADLVLQSEDKNMSLCAVEGWITTDAAEKLFLTAAMDFEELSRQAGLRGFRAVPLGAEASVSIDLDLKYDTSKNVVAILPGTDRADECIVYTAHWDHLGIGPVVDGDSIYNGAADNALPVACMLETAKAFSNLGSALPRSVMFVAVTAEETGLLGSEYYTAHPVIPLEKTVANLNYELFLPLGKMKDVTIYGYGQSELDGYVAKAAGEQGRYVAPEPYPENGMYFRTDHFSFAKRGVPALFVKGWREHAVHGKKWTEEQIQEYWSSHYHRPTDEFDPNTADLAGIVEDAKLFFKIGLALASGTDFPNWNQGSEFRKARDEAMSH